MLSEKNKYLIIVLATVLITSSIIYLTPLRYTSFVEPRINDVEPNILYESYSKNPDNYIFIDVRSVEAYNNLHAKGSKSQPLHTLYDERSSLPKKGKEIILICSGGRASGVGFMYLQHYGFTNIKRVKGGIENWIEQGMPTESFNANEKNI